MYSFISPLLYNNIATNLTIIHAFPSDFTTTLCIIISTDYQLELYTETFGLFKISISDYNGKHLLTNVFFHQGINLQARP